MNGAPRFMWWLIAALLVLAVVILWAEHITVHVR